MKNVIEPILKEDLLTTLSNTMMLAKSTVPYAHRRIADNYMIIKKVYKSHVVQSRITNTEKSLLKKYDFCTLEFTTIKQMNEEIAYLKKWVVSQNELLRKDADMIMQIRAKELKYLAASKYATVTNELYNGYRALERYFEEITKFKNETF